MSGCSSPEHHAPPFPEPPITFLQPDQEIGSRVKDPKAFRSFIRRLQADCDSYFSDLPQGDPQTVEVYTIIKPGRKCRFWLGYSSPDRERIGDEKLLRKLETLKSPPVKEGPVVFSLHLLLWGATETNVTWGQNLPIPKEWRAAIGSNAIRMPDGILPTIWPDE